MTEEEWMDLAGGLLLIFGVGALAGLTYQILLSLPPQARARIIYGLANMASSALNSEQSQNVCEPGNEEF